MLGAALEPERGPAHAYLLHGPAGTGKRAAARAFAAELLSRGARDPGNARTRVEHGAHPDLTWVAPSGAHEMLRRDVDEAVVSAAAHTPFEARLPRVRARARGHHERRGRQLAAEDARGAAVLRRAAAAHRPADAGAADDRLALPAGALRRARRRGARRSGLQSRGVAPDAALACARLALGDGERALGLALGDGPALRARAEALARAPLHGTAATQPWEPRPRRRPGRSAPRPARRSRPRSPRSSPTCPRRSTAGARPSSPSAPGAPSAAPPPAGWTRRCSSSGSGTATSPASPPARPSSPTTATASTSWPQDAAGRDGAKLGAAVELVDDARASLALNVDERLACEALAYRLERELAA